MSFQTKYTQVLSALLLSFIFMFAVRLFFYFSYLDYFSTLNFSGILVSFIMGFRVDIMIIFTFTSLLWVGLLLPFRFVYNTTYRKTLGLVWGTFIASVVFFNIGDALYFGFVNRHLSDELKIIGNDVGILVDMAKDYYPLQTLFGTLIFIAIIYLFFKIFSAKIIHQETKKREWINILLIFIIAFIGIRGKLTGMSFGVSDAFAVNKLQSGNLTLNGFFCFYRAGDRKSINHSSIKLPQAIKIVKHAIRSDKTLYPDNNYPLMRHYKPKAKRSYNIVILMIESLSAKYVDALAHNDYGVTPTLDKMANEGLLFTNFHVNGQRSQEGITSIYTGVIQPVRFGNYFGAEDMPQPHKEQGHPHFGVWDGDMFHFLSSKLHTIKEPFLSFCFTASTHAPYYSPGKEWEKYPHSTKTENGFLNTLNYVDMQKEEKTLS